MKMTTRIAFLIAPVLGCWHPLCLADGETDILFFLSAEAVERSNVTEPTVQTSDFTPTIDILGSYTNGRWRILGEYFLTDDEAELERLQLGYEYRADSTIWFGRMHQPISVWNSRYHHGGYLQPSISRPAIENWEDDGGVIPSHITGTMLDSRWSLNSSKALRIAAAVGLAPRLVDDELLPFDILDPDDGLGHLAASTSISYYPDYVEESNVGLIAAYSEIEANASPTLGPVPPYLIRQTIVGAQLSWEQNAWQVISAAYYFDNDTAPSMADAGGWFASGYAQFLFAFTENTDAYARIERTKNAQSAGYLKLFPNFVTSRDVVGFRYDFAKRQAIAVELSTNEVLTDDYAEIRVQWSAAIP